MIKLFINLINSPAAASDNMNKQDAMYNGIILSKIIAIIILILIIIMFRVNILIL